MECEQEHSGQVCDTSVPCVTAVDVAGDRHKANPSPRAQHRHQAGTMCPCPVLEWHGPSSICSKQSATLALPLASNTPSRRKMPSILFSQRRFCCKKHHMRDEGSRERRECCITIFTHEIKELLFCLFLPEEHFAIAQVRFAEKDQSSSKTRQEFRHTTRYGKPCLSQGRPLAMSLRSIMPRH